MLNGERQVKLLEAAQIQVDKYNIEIQSREVLGFYVWAALISLAVAYCSLRLVFGKDRFDDFIWNLSVRAFGRMRKED